MCLKLRGDQWCSGGDLNPHALRHTPLKRTCLPFHHPSWFKGEKCLTRPITVARMICESGRDELSLIRLFTHGCFFPGVRGRAGTRPYRDPFYGTSAVLIPWRDQARSNAFPQSFKGIS